MSSDIFINILKYFRVARIKVIIYVNIISVRA